MLTVTQITIYTMFMFCSLLSSERESLTCALTIYLANTHNHTYRSSPNLIYTVMMVTTTTTWKCLHFFSSDKKKWKRKNLSKTLEILSKTINCALCNVPGHDMICLHFWPAHGRLLIKPQMQSILLWILIKPQPCIYNYTHQTMLHIASIGCANHARKK